MAIEISTHIHSNQLNEVAIEILSRELAKQLSHEPSVDAKPSSNEAGQNEKGIVQDFSKLLVKFRASSAVDGILECIRNFILREKSLEITVKMQNGREITFNSKNLGDKSINNAKSLLKSMMAE